MTSCFNSSEKNNQSELILSANRAAQIGWVNFDAFADNTFKYSLSRGTKFNGTFTLNGDTFFLACLDTTIGIDKVVIKEKSLEFFGKKNPRFARITINKINK